MTKQTNTVDNLVAKARKAQLVINEYTQDQVDELILAIAWEIIKPENNQYLSEMAVRTTGLGKVADKINKNRRKTIGLLRDLQGVKTVGIISKNKEKGITKIARAIGVIGAIVPSTNPIATPLNKTINAIKCRNAIILAPSPKGAQVCSKMIALMHKAIKRVGAPIEIVQSLSAPITKDNTNELTRQVDLVVATGSQNNILRSIQSGTPTLGVGVGNVPSIIDTSADISAAAHKIKLSKTFDNATSCSSENSIIILKDIYQETIDALISEGGVLLNKAEKRLLCSKMWDDKHIINREIVAKSANTIAKIANISLSGQGGCEFLMVEENGIGKNYPFSEEKLSPVLTIYQANNFEHAIKLANDILVHQGQGHSCSIHSENQAHIAQLGAQLPVSRVIVNQIHCFATGGNFNNGMPFSLSMGCGSWGRNITDENLHYKHYLNITKIVETIETNEPTEEDIFSQYWKKYSTNQSTITDFIDQYATTTPNKTFLIDVDLDLHVSYKKLKQDVIQLGSFLANHHIQSGDKVGFLLDNSYATTLLFLGAMYHGVSIVPINVVSGKQQIQYTIKHSQCKLLFVSQNYSQKFAQTLQGVSADIFVYEKTQDLFCTDNTKPIQFSNTTPDTPGVLIYTSGTTGAPKGVVLSHKAVIAGGRNTVLAHQITPNDISLCVLPLYHINAEMVSISSALVSNSCVVIMSSFSTSNFWQILEKYRCTWFSIVPTIISYLINDNYNVNQLNLSCVRFGRSASAPLPSEVHKKFEQAFSITIIETMGLTETAAQILSNPLDKIKHGSVGVAYGNEVKIINKHDKFVKLGELGELVVKGDNVMKQYYQNPEATKSAFTLDGYLRTGDLGFQDKDGFFFITGRKKELIIKGGENISPREIDDILYKHNTVLEACAFGISDKDYGEEIAACVYLKQGGRVTEDELKSLCMLNLGNYKTPKHIVFTNNPLPKGSSGKIQRLKVANNYYKKLY